MYHRTHEKSAELAQRAAMLAPAGVHSSVRTAAPPVYFERAEGAWLWDVDGNDYIDYLIGQGPMFLGHASAAVNDEVVESLTRGAVFGGRHALEVPAAEAVLEALGWAERVRFAITGTEVDQLAIRLARAATGRRTIIRFEGHYHGWLDNVLTGYGDGRAVPGSAGQQPQDLSESIVLPFNDAGQLEAILREHGAEVAAILIEPVMCNTGVIEPHEGYLEHVRAMADRFGAVLIFDEVITGFRIAPNGAVGRYGVVPDLATFGKALAGGWPVSALAGRADLMDRIDDDVNHSGTFNSSVPAMAAVIATIRQLRSDPPYERIAEHSTQLQAGLMELAAQYKLPLRIQGLPAAFHVSFGSEGQISDRHGIETLDLKRYARFSQTLYEHGVWVTGRGVWYVSDAHGDRELEAVLGRVDAAMAAD